jgi:hypothetical protein
MLLFFVLKKKKSKRQKAVGVANRSPSSSIFHRIPKIQLGLRQAF